LYEVIVLKIYLDVIWIFLKLIGHRGHSKRRKKLGQNLKPIRKLVDGSGSTHEEIDDFVIKGIRESGISVQNRFFDLYYINELEYMIKVLIILVEPDFVPIFNIKEDSLS
jgi:hypothetical protein